MIRIRRGAPPANRRGVWWGVLSGEDPGSLPRTGAAVKPPATVSAIVERAPENVEGVFQFVAVHVELRDLVAILPAFDQARGSVLRSPGQESTCREFSCLHDPLSVTVRARSYSEGDVIVELETAAAPAVAAAGVIVVAGAIIVLPPGVVSSVEHNEF